MDTGKMESIEKRLSRAGKDLSYPPTPSIASAVMLQLNRRTRGRRLSGRWGWALAAAVVLLLALMLVPPARAAVLDFIQIGVVRIFRGPNPAPAPAEIATPSIEAPVTATPAAATGVPTTAPASPTLPVLDLAGETTLSNAQARLEFPILLPTYPPDLGKPDRVYLQDLAGPSMLVLVWLDPDRSGHVRMSLDEITAGSWILEKFNPPVLEEAQVNGQRAIWTEGPYLLQARNHDYVEKRLVAGHVLLWTQGKTTYRLETALTLEEAIKVAESLKPIRSTEIPIPADLDHAQHLVQWLDNAGIAVLSVQHSKEGSLFQSANQAAWIKTNIGVADAVFFLDPAESEYIQVTSIQSQEVGRHLYKVQAPPPIMQEAVTIDAAYPLYFTVRDGLFIETNSPELDKAIQSLPAEVNKTSNPTLVLFLSPTPTSTMTDVPNATTQTDHDTFTLTGEQAQEIAVFMDFLRAYNNGQSDDALGLLAENVGISDCDYQSVQVVTFHGKSQAAGWLQQRLSDHDHLEVSHIDDGNADSASGKYVIGVTYSRRSNAMLTSLGFVDGITPKLSSKVIFTPEPTRILSFANGPYGGDPGLCRPEN